MTLLEREIINNLSVSLYLLPDNQGYLLEIYDNGRLLKVSKLKGITELQAGRVFEREWMLYKTCYE